MNTTLTQLQLSLAEKTTLIDCERIIGKGITTFIEVGQALTKIRDSRLYRGEHMTFEDYCQKRWRMSRPRAYQLIDANGVLQNLSTFVDKPTHESQTRALSGLSPSEQREVWNSALNIMDKPTATVILRKAREIKCVRRIERENEREYKNEVRSIEKHPLKGENFKLFKADIVNGCKSVADESVDAIITDPPYSREHISLYGFLSQVASRVLKPTGNCLIMTGQAHLPDFLNELRRELSYQWILTYLTPGVSVQCFGRKIKSNWKPVIWLTKGQNTWEHVHDIIKSEGSDKRFHQWGQDVTGTGEIIERFTSKKDVVFDPFVGGGATGVASLCLDRLFIGSDIDGTCIAQTAERLKGVMA